MASAATPNIDKLEAVYRSLGGNLSISFQERGAGQGGFFTVTRTVAGASRGCSIGQGDTLAEAFLDEAADYRAITAKVSIASVEKAAA